MRTLTCPRCRKPWEVGALHAGMKASCPHCHASITISAGPAAAKPAHLNGGSEPAPVATAPAITATAAYGPSSSKAPVVDETKVIDGAPPSPSPTSPSCIAEAPQLPTAAIAPPTMSPNGSTSQFPANPAPELSPEAAHESAETPSTAARPKSRRPAAIAAIAILFIVCGVAIVWRPWDLHPEKSISSWPSHQALPISEANSVESAPPKVSTPGAEAALISEAPPVDPVLQAATSQAATSRPSPPETELQRPTPSAAAIKPPSTALTPPTTQRHPQTPAPPTSTPSVIRKPTPPPTYDRSSLEPGTEGTHPITMRTLLKAGDHLHAQHEGRWYAVTVVESLDDGNVRVRWDTWGREIVGNVPRSRLRLPTKK